jgi:hypothetical protein
MLNLQYFIILVILYDDSLYPMSYYKNVPRWAPVAHACNPSHSGVKDQEDCGLKPVPGK